MRRLIQPLVLFPLIWLVANLPCADSLALPAGSNLPMQNPHTRIADRQAALDGVLSVLEMKMGGQSLPAKVRDKLLALSDDQVRLIVALSDRMDGEGSTVGADIAFLLITALIILS